MKRIVYFIPVFVISLLLTGCDNVDLFGIFKPKVDLLEIKLVKSNSVFYVFNIDADDYDLIDGQGVCFSETSEPTIDNIRSEYSHVVGNGELQDWANGLKHETKYYARAYIIYNKEIIYSDQTLKFTTTNGDPHVTTLNARYRTDMRVIYCNGSVNMPKELEVLDCGFCYSTVSGGDPTEFPKVRAEVMGNSFYGFINKFYDGEKYYIRAYATNINGTKYGNEVSCIAADNTTY